MTKTHFEKKYTQKYYCADCKMEIARLRYSNSNFCKICSKIRAKKEDVKRLISQEQVIIPPRPLNDIVREEARKRLIADGWLPVNNDIDDTKIVI